MDIVRGYKVLSFNMKDYKGWQFYFDKPFRIEDLSYGYYVNPDQRKELKKNNIDIKYTRNREFYRYHTSLFSDIGDALLEMQLICNESKYHTELRVFEVETLYDINDHERYDWYKISQLADNDRMRRLIYQPLLDEYHIRPMYDTDSLRIVREITDPKEIEANWVNTYFRKEYQMEDLLYGKFGVETKKDKSNYYKDLIPKRSKLSMFLDQYC